MEHDDLTRFESDIEELVSTLKQVFETDKARWFLHEPSDTLYVEIGGLDEYEESEIESIAGPILEELDLDFEEIILMPLA
ncbi:MAG: hypothetical protein LAT57_05875 [Balneolales bacterium]|nr:hypothetical protein [Balneolales bacterium]